MRASEIRAAIVRIEERRQLLPQERVGCEAELLALRDLLAQFLAATDSGCPESMKAMSIDQIRLLNQLHVAAGL